MLKGAMDSHWTGWDLVRQTEQLLAVPRQIQKEMLKWHDRRILNRFLIQQATYLKSEADAICATAPRAASL